MAAIRNVIAGRYNCRQCALTSVGLVAEMKAGRPLVSFNAR
jgi:hypothetical protein